MAPVTKPVAETPAGEPEPKEPATEPTPELEPTPEPEPEVGPEPEPEETPQARKARLAEEEPAEKRLARIAKGVQRERELHAKRLNEILGDASTDVLPCPVCFEGMQGYVFPGEGAGMSDEQRLAALSFLGEGEQSDVRDAEGVVMCPRCNGWGKLQYPTRVPHVEQQNCPQCGGLGYVPEAAPVTAQPAGGVVVEMPPQAPQPSGLACPLCGAPGMAGMPHWCNPAQPVAV